MILSPNRSSRGGAKVRLIAIHTAEGARTKESLGSYFQGPVDASSHVGIDAGGVESYVPYEEKSWTLLNGNPISENAELCAFARWTRAQWMSTTAVDGCANPKKMLDNAADWIRARCLARGIPIRKIDAAAIKRGEAGVIGHIDWTNTGDGNHTDPGPNFPWDYVIARAAGAATQEDDMPFTPQQLQDNVYAAVKNLFIDAHSGANPGARNAIRGVLDGLFVADVDEEELADALAKRGVAGADPAAIKAAMVEVLHGARISVEEGN